MNGGTGLTRYLTADEIVEIHDAEVGHTEVDLRGIEAIAARPQHTFDGDELLPSLHEKAAALFHGLATTQYFDDGNKRTAVLVLLVFYGMNGHRTSATNLDVYHLAEDVATKSLAQRDLIEQLEGMFYGPPDDFE